MISQQAIRPQNIASVLTLTKASPKIARTASALLNIWDKIVG